METLNAVRDRARKLVESYPLTAAAVAFVLGAVLL
jgi:hypothetical protein